MQTYKLKAAVELEQEQQLLGGVSLRRDNKQSSLRVRSAAVQLTRRKSGSTFFSVVVSGLMEAGHTATGAAPRLAVQDQNQNYVAKRFKTLPRHRWAADRSETSTSDDAQLASSDACESCCSACLGKVARHLKFHDAMKTMHIYANTWRVPMP